MTFFLFSACSLDMRISDLSSTDNRLNQNPSTESPLTPESPSSNLPVNSKPSGEPFFNYTATGITKDSDGRTIYSGNFSSFTFDKKNVIPRIARLNSDGSIDETFNPGSGYNSAIQKIFLTAAQEVIAIGNYSQFDYNNVTRITKLQTNGNLNTAFTPELYAEVYDIGHTSSGQMIAIGSFYYWSDFATPQESIVRINPDGTRDISFNIGSSFNPVRTATEIAIQSDNKMIIGGNFNSYRGSSSPKIVRLNSDGSYDNTFVTGTGFDGAVHDLELLSDGRVVVVGAFTSYNGTSSVNRVALLNTNGSIDTSFTTNIGAGFASAPYVVKEIPGMGILIGGSFNSFQGSQAGGIICLNYNGTLCSSVNFGVGVDVGAGQTIYDFKKLNNSTLLVAGLFNNFNSLAGKNLVALNLDGSSNNQLANFKGVDSSVNCIQIQNDGKIVIGGNFTIYNPQTIPKIVRFNADQTLDEDFTTAVKNAANITSVGEIVVDASDNVWISGMLTPNGYGAIHLLKLTETGSIDSSCISALGSGFNSLTTKVSLLDNGKILLNGNFSSFDGNPASKSAILNSDCTLDANFSTGSGVVGSILKTHRQSDGKFIYVGTISSYSGTTVSKVIRVDSSGVLDPTYPNNAAKPNNISASYLDSSDRLYISSASGTFNGTAVGNFSRILPNGTVDTSFNIGTGFDKAPLVAKVFNNKIFVGGDFITYNSTSRRFFIILNEDGTEDTSTSRPEAVMAVKDIYFNSVTGKIEFAYKLPEIAS